MVPMSNCRDSRSQSLKIVDEVQIANLCEFYRNMDGKDHGNDLDEDKAELHDNMNDDYEKPILKQIQRKKRKCSFWDSVLSCT